MNFQFSREMAWKSVKNGKNNQFRDESNFLSVDCHQWWLRSSRRQFLETVARASHSPQDYSSSKSTRQTLRKCEDCAATHMIYCSCMYVYNTHPLKLLPCKIRSPTEAVRGLHKNSRRTAFFKVNIHQITFSLRYITTETENQLTWKAWNLTLYFSISNDALYWICFLWYKRPWNRWKNRKL